MKKNQAQTIKCTWHDLCQLHLIWFKLPLWTACKLMIMDLEEFNFSKNYSIFLVSILSIKIYTENIYRNNPSETYW